MKSSSKKLSDTKQSKIIVGVLFSGLIADSRRGVVPLVRAVAVSEDLAEDTRPRVLHSLLDVFISVCELMIRYFVEYIPVVFFVLYCTVQIYFIVLYCTRTYGPFHIEYPRA